MGFLDKAKKLADQAQTKLDEVQKDFNAKQRAGEGGAAGGGSPVEYDDHGRPVAVPEPVGAPVPDAPADKSPTIDPGAPGASPEAEPAKQHGDPLMNDEPGSRQGTAPKPPESGSGLSSGDPLAG
jgi:hypothetical protein